MRVRWTVEASAELDDILVYIAAQDTRVASLVAERVLKAEESIRRFPNAARHDAETDTYDRYIPKTRIILTYAVRDDAVWIVTVWHTSRDPEAKPARR